MFNVPDWQTVPIPRDLPNIWNVLELSTPPLLVRTPSKINIKITNGCNLGARRLNWFLLWRERIHEFLAKIGVKKGFWSAAESRRTNESLRMAYRTKLVNEDWFMTLLALKVGYPTIIH